MIKENIQRLVANAKIEQAIDEFINWASANDDDINNSLILIKGQYSALKRQENLGLMSFSDASRDRARIANSILELSNQITEGGRTENIKLATQAQFFNKQEQQNNLTSTSKILFLAANPSNTTKLDLEKEFAKIHNKLQDTDFRLYSEWAVTASQLTEVLLEIKPRIVHFSGHGQGDKSAINDDSRAIGHVKDGEQPTGIILEDSTKKAKVVSKEAIAELFSICLEEFIIDAVILNACYSKEQANAIHQAGIPYVIGMNKAINDNTAIEFSTGFYMGIAKVNDIKKAFRIAVNAIRLEGLSGDDIPVLYEKD